MEVHHHGHVHEKKKWKEYLFQFFMLFLAVFCGFLAEWKLEHTIEHSREKQFMQSLVEDVEKDVVALDNEILLIKEQTQGLDMLVLIIYNDNISESDISKLYELQKRFLRPLRLRLINRTELQLKNAGGMRLIRNREVSDSIINYWSMTEILYEIEENINAHRDRAKDLSFSIFNNYYFDEGIDFNFNIFKRKPELMKGAETHLTEFANRVSHMSELLKFQYLNRRLTIQSEYGKRLIEFVKKEYHLQ